MNKLILLIVGASFAACAASVETGSGGHGGRGGEGPGGLSGHGGQGAQGTGGASEPVGAGGYGGSGGLGQGCEMNTGGQGGSGSPQCYWCDPSQGPSLEGAPHHFSKHSPRCYAWQCVQTHWPSSYFECCDSETDPRCKAYICDPQRGGFAKWARPHGPLCAAPNWCVFVDQTPYICCDPTTDPACCDTRNDPSCPLSD